MEDLYKIIENKNLNIEDMTILKKYLEEKIELKNQFNKLEKFKKNIKKILDKKIFDDENNIFENYFVNFDNLSIDEDIYCEYSFEDIVVRKCILEILNGESNIIKFEYIIKYNIIKEGHTNDYYLDDPFRENNIYYENNKFDNLKSFIEYINKNINKNINYDKLKKFLDEIFDFFRKNHNNNHSEIEFIQHDFKNDDLFWN